MLFARGRILYYFPVGFTPTNFNIICIQYNIISRTAYASMRRVGTLWKPLNVYLIKERRGYYAKNRLSRRDTWPTVIETLTQMLGLVRLGVYLPRSVTGTDSSANMYTPNILPYWQYFTRAYEKKIIIFNCYYRCVQRYVLFVINFCFGPYLERSNSHSLSH